MTIEERAAKAYPQTNEFSLTSFNFGIMLERRGAYIKGATDQQKIDIEKAWHIIKELNIFIHGQAGVPLTEEECMLQYDIFKKEMEK